jgi:polysaccharide pyruvyl transferase WcaK-like protein
VGLFGNLGSGNIGNDASLEAMLKYLAADQPGAVLDAMCAGPQTVKDRYGVPAIALRWLPPGERRPGHQRGPCVSRPGVRPGRADRGGR